jgi:hypothetical protein
MWKEGAEMRPREERKNQKITRCTQLSFSIYIGAKICNEYHGSAGQQTLK